MQQKIKKPIRVLVVDDSAFMRKLVSDILKSDTELEVVSTAKNGLEAIKLAAELKPDVITLDVEMPVMDGFACLKEMQKSGIFVPVIMISNLTQQGADITIKCLEQGAVDFITKPTNIFDINSKGKNLEIIEKVKIAKKSTCRIKYEEQPPKQFGRYTTVSKPDPAVKVEKSNRLSKIVAIGTSTGGPKALQSVLPLIPGNIPAAFLIVQHMPPGFTKSLADRLNNLSQLCVKEAENGDIISPGTAYIAPGDFHMTTERLVNGSIKIKLTKDPPFGGHRPSVDTMFNSLSETGLNNIISVIMTGMGSDGSKGVLNLKTLNKSYVIAQDESSSVVYGMPKMAVKTGAVDKIVPLNEIAAEIIRNVGVQ